MPRNVNGPLSAGPGQGAWTWSTGSAVWNLRAVIEGVLGIRPTFAGLSLPPDLPASWEGFHPQRWFRGALYEIEVWRFRPGEYKGVRVNGQPYASNSLPSHPPAKPRKLRWRSEEPEGYHPGHCLPVSLGPVPRERTCRRSPADGQGLTSVRSAPGPPRAAFLLNAAAHSAPQGHAGSQKRGP